MLSRTHSREFEVTERNRQQFFWRYPRTIIYYSMDNNIVRLCSQHYYCLCDPRTKKIIISQNLLCDPRTMFFAIRDGKYHYKAITYTADRKIFSQFAVWNECLVMVVAEVLSTQKEAVQLDACDNEIYRSSLCLPRATFPSRTCHMASSPPKQCKSVLVVNHYCCDLSACDGAYSLLVTVGVAIGDCVLDLSRCSSLDQTYQLIRRYTHCNIVLKSCSGSLIVHDSSCRLSLTYRWGLNIHLCLC